MHNATTREPESASLGLVVTVHDGWAYYKGTSAELRAEGVSDIPEWPEGRAWKRWSNGSYDFTLIRTRPPGMKGPMREWLTGDHWRLRFMPCGVEHTACYMERVRTEREYKAALRNSATSIFERTHAVDRAVKASSDAKFQAVMARIRGR